MSGTGDPPRNGPRSALRATLTGMAIRVRAQWITTCPVCDAHRHGRLHRRSRRRREELIVRREIHQERQP